MIGPGSDKNHKWKFHVFLSILGQPAGKSPLSRGATGKRKKFWMMIKPQLIQKSFLGIWRGKGGLKIPTWTAEGHIVHSWNECILYWEHCIISTAGAPVVLWSTINGPYTFMQSSVPEAIQELNLTGFLCFLFRSTPRPNTAKYSPGQPSTRQACSSHNSTWLSNQI